jgi:hypothetical protein
MILDIETGRAITYQPHRPTWNLIQARMKPQQIADVVHEVWQRTSGVKIFSPSFIAGKNWTGTRLQPIYEDGAHYSEILAAMMWGLLAWEAIRQHPDQWFTLRAHFPVQDFEKRVYFRNRSSPIVGSA